MCVTWPVPIVSDFQKQKNKSYLFPLRQVEMPKNAFQRVILSALHGFSANVHQEKEIALKCCTPVAGIYFYEMNYLLLFDKSNILNFMDICFYFKSKFWLLRLEIYKTSKSEIEIL